MPSSERSLFPALLAQDLRSLFGSLAFLAMLILLSLLVGYSFIQAVDLFSQASRTALAYPALGSGLDPVEGIFVPTFGAYYLIETLLLPLVVIQLGGRERQTGTLKLLLQLPLRPSTLMSSKLAALAIGGLPLFAPAALAIAAWLLQGGVIYWPELGTLLLGHLLHGLAIISIALFAAVIASSPASAAMISLGVTLGSWVLDFASANGGWMELAGKLSLTRLLRPFEEGLLTSPAVAAFVILSLLFIIAATIFLHPGHSLATRLKALLPPVILLAGIGGLVATHPLYLDASEDLRHSFGPADTRALETMKSPLRITIHMSRDDSRFQDFERSILAKLRRSVPRLELRYADTSPTSPFGAPEDDRYGLIEFDYAGRHDESYSTSPQEILPLIHALAGHKVPGAGGKAEYGGHPLVADMAQLRWWFYLFLPLLFMLWGMGMRYPMIRR